MSYRISNSNHYVTLLSNRRLIRMSGADARAFLQGLISCDVAKLEQGSAAYGLLLTPQGKFLHDMFIVAHGEDLLLDVAANQVELLLKRLKLYKLKRNVEFEFVDDWQVSALWADAELLETHQTPYLSVTDPRLKAMGVRVYAPSDVNIYFSDATKVTEDEYHAHRVGHGVADGSDMIADKSFPLDFDMDDLAAIHYKKGCYVGQEVTARMHYKATPKKGLYLCVSRTGQELPDQGTEIIADAGSIGTLLSVAGSAAIAVLKHEILAAAEAGTIHASGVPLLISRPVWAKSV